MDDRRLDRLSQRLDDLDWQLSSHFEELKAATEQRDLFVLGAVWGIVRGVFSFAALAGTPYLFHRWFGWDGWWSGLAGIVGAMVVLVAMSAWHERGQKDDEKKLWRLPEWRSGSRYD